MSTFSAILQRMRTSADTGAAVPVAPAPLATSAPVVSVVPVAQVPVFSGNRRYAIIAAGIVLIVLIIWGGYKLYKGYGGKKKPKEVEDDSDSSDSEDEEEEEEEEEDDDSYPPPPRTKPSNRAIHEEPVVPSTPAPPARQSLRPAQRVDVPAPPNAQFDAAAQPVQETAQAPASGSSVPNLDHIDDKMERYRILMDYEERRSAERAREKSPEAPRTYADATRTEPSVNPTSILEAARRQEDALRDNYRQAVEYTSGDRTPPAPAEAPRQTSFFEGAAVSPPEATPPTSPAQVDMHEEVPFPVDHTTIAEEPSAPQ